MNKQTLRNKYLEKRKALTINEKALLEDSMLNHLFESFSFLGKISSCFLPISAKNEIDTWQLLTKICADGGQVGLTVWNTEVNTLSHRLYSEDTMIALNSFGIPEPVNGKIITTEQLDYVFVPLLVADLNGHRVGYGKGVYDRFLSTCSSKTKFIGLSLFELENPIEDVNDFDIALHACITPTNSYYFEK